MSDTFQLPEFDVIKAASDDKLERQAKQSRRFIVVDTRAKFIDRSDELTEMLHSSLTNYKFTIVDKSSPLSEECLAEHGLVFVVSYKRCLVLFEGSFLSNFEPAPIKLADEKGRKSVEFKSAEQYFQVAKCATVASKQEFAKEEVLEVGRMILKTDAPSYMVSLARKMQPAMRDEAVTAWRSVNLELLEYIVRKKMELHPEMPLLVSIVVSVFNVSMKDLEFFECNPKDDFFGTKSSLADTLQSVPADGLGLSKLAGKNCFGNILTRIFRAEPFSPSSAVAEVNQALLTHYASSDSDTEDTPALSRCKGGL